MFLSLFSISFALCSPFSRISLHCLDPYSWESVCWFIEEKEYAHSGI